MLLIFFLTDGLYNICRLDLIIVISLINLNQVIYYEYPEVMLEKYPKFS